MMNNYLPTDFQQYIHLSRYSRWLPEKNRRETWEETVERYFNFFQQHLAENHNHDITPYRSELQNAVLSLEVMPSMRAMMTAGEALRREPMSGFNCSYLAVDNLRSFDEILYVLMNGTGAGFSVETKYVDQLPSNAESFHESETVIVVSDSKLGWAKALRELIGLLYLGQIPRWDVSRVRPAGSPLKTFGGRASGPGPLVDLFQFCVNTFKKAAGRKLTQLEAHDIVCKIAEIVVVGGVRRCLPGDARIQSENGYVYMKDITVGDKIITGGKPYRVLEKVASGKQKIINIQHQFGVLRCTENHEVAVFNSMKEYIFKKASDIKLDDALVWDTFGTPGRIGVDIPKYNTTQNSRCKPVTFPEKVTTDLAWIVGLVHGDGYVSDRCVSITTNNNDIQLLDEANCIMETVFGISGTKKPYSKSDCTDIRFYSKELAGWFRENIKTPKNPIRIPEWIFGADSSTRYAYLAGLFDSDGRITTDGGIDQVTTVYESLKSDVVTLLATLGIGSKIIHKVNNRRRDNGVNAQDFYTIRIIGQTNRNAWTNVQHYCQSNKIGKLLTSKVTGYDFSFPITIHGVTQTHRNRNMSTIAALSKGLIDNMNYLPTRVIGIEYGPEEETYDIEVEDVHQFTVDGLVVHNSALISLSDLSDDRMRQAKSGQWWVDHVQRALANNSAVYNEKPDIGIFMDEWKALYESKSGERGIFNRQAGKRHMEKFGRRDSKPDHGVNPCLTGDTLINTTSGLRRIIDLIGIPFTAIVEGKELHCPEGFFFSGAKETLEIKTFRGHSIRATDNHRFLAEKDGKREWIEVSKLLPGDTLAISNNSDWSNSIDVNKKEFDLGWLLGEVVGDGGHNPAKYNSYVRFWGESAEEMVTKAHAIMMENNFLSENKKIPTFNKINKTYTLGSKKFTEFCAQYIRTKNKDIYHTLYLQSNSFLLGFLRGLFDADGSLQGIENGRNSPSIRLSQSNIKRLEEVQIILNRFGIFSTLRKLHDDETRTWPNGHTYVSKSNFELLITKDSILSFINLVGFYEPVKSNKAKILLESRKRGFYNTNYITEISEIIKRDIEPVFDCTIDDDSHMFEANGLISHNCGEILLRNGQVCNLSEAVIRATDSEEDISRKIRLATILGTWQSTLTNFKYLSRKWRDNSEEERLLGVSMTGITDSTLTNGKVAGLPERLDRWRELAVATNREFADKLGINPSVAVTCVKPSGTVSSLVNSGSGIHSRHSPYYIRSVRADKKDPLAKMMVDMGFPVEDDVTKPDHNYVFFFPIKSPENAIFRDDVTATEQLELWLTYKKHFTEHNPSVTITIQEHEWLEVGAWTYKNFDNMTGVSFLPASDTVYKQMPYQTCTKEEYEELLHKMPKNVDWSKLSEYELNDMTIGSQELACVAGGCEI